MVGFPRWKLSRIEYVVSAPCMPRGGGALGGLQCEQSSFGNEYMGQRSSMFTEPPVSAIVFSVTTQPNLSFVTCR